MTSDPDMLATWRNIVELRNATFPFHPTDQRFLELVAFFGQNYPPDLAKLWMDVLNRFLVSITKLRDLLSKLVAKA